MPRRRVLMAAAFLGLFLGGGAAGGLLARTFAAGSWIVEVMSFFALPTAFAVSLQTWYGLALLGVLPRLVGALRNRSSDAPRGAPVRSGAPLPGSFVFLPMSAGAGALAGIVAGLLSPTHSFWTVAPAYWLLGTVHGVTGWRLARAGVLLPPES